MAFYKCGLSGGTSQTKSGTFTTSTTSNVSVPVGFKPDLILYWVLPDSVTSTPRRMHMWSTKWSSTYQFYTANNNYFNPYSIGTTTINGTKQALLATIDSSGFSVYPSATTYTFNYLAVKF